MVAEGVYFFYLFVKGMVAYEANYKARIEERDGVLDLKSRGCAFEPHRRHFIVSLSKTLYPLLCTGSTQEDPSRHN